MRPIDDRPLPETELIPQPRIDIEPVGKAPTDLPQIPGYMVEELIGKGGMGVVYRARQVKTGRRVVALKIIQPRHLSGDLAEIAKAQSRFQREIEATARLQHEHIVQIYEAGESGGDWFYAMQFIAGDSLRGWIRKQRLTPNQAVQFVEQAARGLTHAHELGVVHRDISPDNILIDEAKQRALVADFGLAKLHETTEASTQATEVLGKHAYMPPEQYSGEADERADIYSLGITLYEAITGRLPFAGRSFQELAMSIQQTQPPSPRKLVPSLSSDLETICLKCLEKSPADRYQTATALADDLSRFRHGEPILARPLSRVERLARWVRHNQRLAGALAASVLLLLSLILVGWAAQGQLGTLRGQNVQEAFAKSLVTARSLGQQGDWRQALVLLQELKSFDSASETRRQLEVARAHLALDDLQSYRAAVEVLGQRKDSGELAAQVSLFSANVSRLEGNVADADAKTQAAIDLGLAPAQRFFALSLLADSTPEAKQHLENALAADPLYQEALADLTGLHLMYGEHELARSRIQAGRLLFPQDIRLPMFAALSHALCGENEAVERELQPLEQRLTPQQVKDFRQAVERISQSAETLERSIIGSSDPSSLRDMMQLGSLLLKLWESQRSTANPEEGLHSTDVILSGATFPPVLRKFFVPMRAVILRQINPLEGMLNGDGQMLADLASAAKVHPDAALFFWQASLHVRGGRFQEALEPALQGAHSPALFKSLRVRCRTIAAVCIVQPEAKDLPLPTAQRANDQIRRALQEGDLQADEWLFAGRVAVHAQDTPLIAEIFSRWEKVNPGHPNIAFVRAENELKAGRLGAAAEYLEIHLQKFPQSPLGLKLKSQIEEAGGSAKSNTPPET